MHFPKTTNRQGWGWGAEDRDSRVIIEVKLLSRVWLFQTHGLPATRFPTMWDFLGKVLGEFVIPSPVQLRHSLNLGRTPLSANWYSQSSKKWILIQEWEERKGRTTDWYCQGLLLKDNRNSELWKQKVLMLKIHSYNTVLVNLSMHFCSQRKVGKLYKFYESSLFICKWGK